MKHIHQVSATNITTQQEKNTLPIVCAMNATLLYNTSRQCFSNTLPCNTFLQQSSQHFSINLLCDNSSTTSLCNSTSQATFPATLLSNTSLQQSWQHFSINPLCNTSLQDLSATRLSQQHFSTTLPCDTSLQHSSQHFSATHLYNTFRNTSIRQFFATTPLPQNHNHKTTITTQHNTHTPQHNTSTTPQQKHHPLQRIIRYSNITLITPYPVPTPAQPLGKHSSTLRPPLLNWNPSLRIPESNNLPHPNPS